jgi:hypothetical protein
VALFVQEVLTTGGEQVIVKKYENQAKAWPSLLPFYQWSKDIFYLDYNCDIMELKCTIQWD